MKPLLSIAILAAFPLSVLAQTADGPPVDTAQLLQALKQIREQSETALKSKRTTALQQVMAAAGTPEAAGAFWTNAVLAVQFAGVDHQSAAVREWNQGDGEGLKVREGANAARLHLYWLGLTLQHASGTETKQLLNSVLDFTRQVEVENAMIAKITDQIAKARDRAPAGKKPPVTKSITDAALAKKVHDSIMKMSVANSPVARWLQISELVAPAGGKKKGEGNEAPGWEMVPGNVNGIYSSVILPEFRATKDPRVLDYWDMVIKAETAGIYAGMPDFEERRWNQVRRPSLLWSRAQDVFLIGQRNRAVTEMFNLIKTHPQHPDIAAWIATLEGRLNPAAVRPPAPAVAPAQPGTSPGDPPVATLLPAPPAAVPPGGRAPVQ